MKTKIITVLRYIFAIPTAFILSRLVYVVILLITALIELTSVNLYEQGMKLFATGLSNFAQDSLSLTLWNNIFCPALFIYLVYKLAPKHKVAYVIIAITLYSTIYAIAVTIILLKNADNIIETIFISLACIASMIITGVVNIKIAL